MESFWDEKHKISCEWWLSKCYTGDMILEMHGLKNFELAGKTVLDIGIGAGYLSNYLNECKSNVISCDISKEALKNVESFAKTFHTSELKNIPPVDLAISNLVFQHCNDDEVARIIKEVNLKKNGIFSFQFAYLRPNEPPNELTQKLIDGGTHHFRTLKQIIDMVNRGNKKLVEISDSKHFYSPENFSWKFVKIGPC